MPAVAGRLQRKIPISPAVIEVNYFTDLSVFLLNILLIYLGRLMPHEGGLSSPRILERPRVSHRSPTFRSIQHRAMPHETLSHHALLPPVVKRAFSHARPGGAGNW